MCVLDVVCPSSWSALLPLANTCQSLEAHAAASGAPEAAGSGPASGVLTRGGSGMSGGGSKEAAPKRDVYAY